MKRGRAQLLLCVVARNLGSVYVLLGSSSALGFSEALDFSETLDLWYLSVLYEQQNVHEHGGPESIHCAFKNLMGEASRSGVRTGENCGCAEKRVT